MCIELLLCGGGGLAPCCNVFIYGDLAMNVIGGNFNCEENWMEREHLREVKERSQT